MLDALVNLQGSTESILQRVQVLEQQATRREPAEVGAVSSIPLGSRASEGDQVPPTTKADNFYRALEQAEQGTAQWPGNESKKYKSGQFRVGGEIPCRKFIPWPHDLCFVGTECKRVTYDELSPLQWMCGFIRTILKTTPDCHLNMLTYASDLLQNALDLGWPMAKGSYKVLMTEMEATELFWDNLLGVQAVRQQYAQRNVRPAFSSTPDLKHFGEGHWHKSTC